MDTGKIIRGLSFSLILGLALLGRQGSAHPKVEPLKRWSSRLEKRIAELELQYPGKIGVYVKDLETGEDFSFRARESWYIASGVKVPIALAVLDAVDQGRLTLDMSVKLRAEDYVDGAGETNRFRPGREVSIRFLLEQMLMQSDNTASDHLIRLAGGVERVNEALHARVPRGFSRITTLADVRRNAYAMFHPAAFRLQSGDFLKLKAVADEDARLQTLARLLGVRSSEFKYGQLMAGYSAYYEGGLNSAALWAYGALLEKLAGKESRLTPESAAFLLETMSRATTGKQRIKAGLPPTITFAHKTGTQLARICDFGLAWATGSPRSRKVAIAACVRNVPSLATSERALALVGHAIADSGVFSPVN